MKTIKEYLGKVSITCNGLWDVQREYDRLCLVHDGFFASYVSRKSVPAGTPLTNTEYWQPVASLRDDVKVHAKEFEEKVIQLLAQIQLKLKSARIVVKDIAERDALTINEVAPGCEVYVLETKQSWILDSIVCSSDKNNNYKEWHLEIDSKIDSEEQYELEGEFDNLTADRAICDAYGNIIHDTYITRETIHNYVDGVINDFISNWKYEIQDNTITYDMLSESLKQFIGSNGNITNMADEEDLTVVDNQLKLKDREYKADEFSGKGYKILRKNWMNNVNLLEQSMINEDNTIYEVRYLFCLDAQTVKMPTNSVLYLNGGQINNGTIELNETPIRGIYKLSDFGTATITGTFAKGQLLYIDDREAMCVWTGTEWINIYGVNFRWADDNSIDISYDGGQTWKDLSPVFTNQLAIKDIVSSVSNIPSSAVIGDIYSVGPTYASDDSEHTKPIYTLYLVTESGNVSLGSYNSISAGIVQELGDSETEVISQKEVTRQFSNKGSFISLYSILGNNATNVDNIQNILLSIPQNDRVPFATIKYRDINNESKILTYKSSSIEDNVWSNLNNWNEISFEKDLDTDFDGIYTDRDSLKTTGIYKSQKLNGVTQSIIIVHVFDDIVYQTEIGNSYNNNNILLRNRKFENNTWGEWSTYNLIYMYNTINEILNSINNINNNIVSINNDISIYSNNLLNANDLINGYYIGTSDGLIKQSISYPNAAITNKIYIDNSKVYHIQGRGSGTGIIGYDENDIKVIAIKDRQDYDCVLNGDIQFNSNVKSIQFTVTLQGNDYDKIMFSKGIGEKEYIEYKKIPINEYVSNISNSNNTINYKNIYVTKIDDNHISIYSHLYDKYYINFGLLYTKDDSINSDYYRLSTSYLCELVNNKFNNLFSVLQYNENEYVFHIKNGIDSTGGYHGDEKLTSIKIFIDDIPYDINDIPIDSFIVGNTCYYIENSNMYGNAISDNNIIANHYKKTTFNKGYYTENIVNFLKELTIDSLYGGLSCIDKNVSSEFVGEDLQIIKTIKSDNTTYPNKFVSDISFNNRNNNISAHCSANIEYGLDINLQVEVWDRTFDTKYYFRSKENNKIEANTIYKTNCKVIFNYINND